MMYPPILQVYGVADESELERIKDAIRVHRKLKRNSTYDSILSTGHRRYLTQEAQADELAVYDPQRLPDFFSTEAYCRSLEALRSSEHNGQDELYARFRGQRAASLLTGTTTLRVIIDASAFHRPIGNEATPANEFTEVITAIQGIQQLITTPKDHLNPNIRVQIAPYTRAGITTESSAFSVASAVGQPIAAHIGRSTRGTFWIEEVGETGRYRQEFNELSRRLPPADETNDILSGILSTLQDY